MPSRIDIVQKPTYWYMVTEIAMPSKQTALREPQPVLARTFLRRSVKMLERLSASASPEALETALSAPTDIGGVASLLSDLAPFGLDVSAFDPLVEAMARGAAVKRDLLRAAGGGLSSQQVADALGITRQGVDKRRLRRGLLAVPSGSGEYLYPACQFTPDGVIPGFEAILRAFAVHNPWTQLSVLLAQAPGLRGQTILEALRAGDVAGAAAIAASFGVQGG